MKNLSAISFLVTITAAIVLPVSAAVAGTLFLAGGLAALLIGDYAAAPRLALPGETRAAVAAARRAETLGLAA